MLYDQTGSGKSNMATSKQEVHISQLVDVIETKFQRLYLCFGVKLSRWVFASVYKNNNNNNLLTKNKRNRMETSEEI